MSDTSASTPKHRGKRKRTVEDKLIVTAAEFARELGWSPSKVRKLCQNGLIRTVGGLGHGVHIPQPERQRILKLIRGEGADPTPVFGDVR